MKNNQHKTVLFRFKPSVLLLILIVLGFSLLQTQVSHSAAYSIQYDPNVAAIIAQVNQTTLYGYVSSLSGLQPATIGGSSYTLRTRNTDSGTPVQKATQYVYEYLQTLTGMDSVSYDAWQAGGSSSRNVVGVLTGKTRPTEIVLLTAHLDDMPNGATAPGADDNASGAAALMNAASLLNQHSFDRTIRFIFFTGEEQDFYGSADYAKAARSAGENIVAVMNMDMLGWESDGKPTMRIHTRPVATGAKDLEIANLFVGVTSAYAINLTPIVTSYGMSDSDHGSFWAQDYPAVCVIEDDGDQQSWGDFNPYYHTTSDTLDKLNMPYFTRIVAATVGSVAHLAFLNDGAPAATVTITRTPTWTTTLTRTPTYTSTRTPAPATATTTSTRTPTRTTTPTNTLSVVATNTPTRTPTHTASPTYTPTTLVTATQTATSLPGSAIIVNPALSPAPGGLCSTGWLKIVLGGYNSSNLYLTTNVTKLIDSYNSGKWTPNISTTGRYQVEAYIGHHDSVKWSCPSVTVARNTAKARYVVHYSGGKTTVVLNQSSYDNAWAKLGEFTFAAGKSGYIFLNDVTTETDASRLLVYNVLRLTWVGP